MSSATTPFATERHCGGHLDGFLRTVVIGERSELALGNSRQAKKQLALEREVERQRAKQEAKDRQKAALRRQAAKRAERFKQADEILEAYKERRSKMSDGERRNSNILWASAAAAVIAVVIGLVIAGSGSDEDDEFDFAPIASGADSTDRSDESDRSGNESSGLTAREVESYLERNFSVTSWYSSIGEISRRGDAVWVETSLGTSASAREAAAGIRHGVPSLLFSAENPDPSVDAIRIGAASGERLVLRDGLGDGC